MSTVTEKHYSCAYRLHNAGLLKVGTTYNQVAEILAEVFPLRRKSGDPLGIGWTLETGWTGIDAGVRKSWSIAYPAVNIDQTLASMHLWLVSHPNSKKTNWTAFIDRWFRGDQQKARTVAVQTYQQPPRPKAAPPPRDWKEYLRRNMPEDPGVRRIIEYCIRENLWRDVPPSWQLRCRESASGELNDLS